MSKPVGLTSKLKNNDNKHPRISEEWRKGKKLGRPAQQYNALTHTWSKVMEPRKVSA